MVNKAGLKKKPVRRGKTAVAKSASRSTPKGKPKGTPSKKISAGPIKKTLLIGDVVNKYPETVEIMLARGFHCIGCHVSPFETIEQGASVHGISDKELDKMLGEMNKVLSKRGK